MNPDLSAPCQTSLNTGMAWSVLAEVQSLLERLNETGETAAVDLRGLPLTGADRQELEASLGRGEVSCTLELMGRTDIWETAFSGVWWVRHRGAGDKVSSETLVIAPIPDILLSQADDVAESVRRLAERVTQGPGGDEARETEQEETSHA